MANALDHGSLMDRVYRRQRHVYDATRKYYLLGRDPMLAGLAVPAGGSVLEIGCGTGRNLIKAAALYPDATLYGIDISTEMLASAETAIRKSALQGRTYLALGDATAFEPERLFGRTHFDRIFIAYAVSMIPAWRQSIRHAARYLPPGGSLHIVDFGDLAGLPAWSRTALYRWLASFHVTPRGDLFHVARNVAREIDGSSEAAALYRGFAWSVIVRR